MHIPENYLSPSTCAVMTAAMLPVWGYSIHKITYCATSNRLCENL